MTPLDSENGELLRGLRYKLFCEREYRWRRVLEMPGETISPEHAASLVKSGMWLDYGASLCQPDVFDQALAARKDEPANVKIRSCLSMRPRAVIEDDPEGRQFHMFNWHFSGCDRKKRDALRKGR
jgi:acyl-CoA hydrolase